MMGRIGRHGDSGGWPFIAVGASVFFMFMGLSQVTRNIGPASIPIWFAALGAGALVLRGPLGKALADRLSGQSALPNEPVQLPEELYAELDELRARLGELEERVDFSERLLSRQDAPPPPPSTEQ